MTPCINIYVPASLVTYGGTFDAGNSHLLNVMRLLQRFGVVHISNMPVRFKTGSSIAYSITYWGRNLAWWKDERRGYWVSIPVEEY